MHGESLPLTKFFEVPEADGSLSVYYSGVTIVAFVCSIFETTTVARGQAIGLRAGSFLVICSAKDNDNTLSSDYLPQLPVKGE